MDEKKVLDVELTAQLNTPHADTGLNTSEIYNNNRDFIHSVIDVLNIENNDSILEIGPASGQHVKYLFDRSEKIHYTGIDRTEVIIDEQKRENQKYISEGKAEYYLGSSDHLPFKDNTFDKIFTINTIYFFDEIETHLKEILRVLKPEGTVCIGFMSKDFMRALPFTNTGFMLYNPGDAIQMFEHNGFKNSKSISWKEKSFIGVKGHVVEKEYIILSARK